MGLGTVFEMRSGAIAESPGSHPPDRGRSISFVKSRM